MNEMIKTKSNYNNYGPANGRPFVLSLILFLAALVGLPLGAASVMAQDIVHSEEKAPLFVKETAKVSYLLWLSTETQRQTLVSEKKPRLELVQINQAKTDVPILINLILSPLDGLEGQGSKIVYDLSIIKPDGSPYDHTPVKGLLAFNGAWPQKGNFVMNGPDQVKLRFESNDPFGNYRIILEAIDLVSGQKTRLEAQIKHVRPSKP